MVSHIDITGEVKMVYRGAEEGYGSVIPSQILTRSDTEFDIGL